MDEFSYEESSGKCGKADVPGRINCEKDSFRYTIGNYYYKQLFRMYSI